MNRAGAGSRNSLFVLLAVAMLAIGLDVGVARITYGVVLPAFARDLQLSLTAAGLLGTLHLIGYLFGTLASPWLNAKVGALALCRASHLVFACAMLVCGLTSNITTMAASRLCCRPRRGLRSVLGLSHRLRRDRAGRACGRGIARLVRHWRRNRRERACCRPDARRERMAPFLHRAGGLGARGRGVHSAPAIARAAESPRRATIAARRAYLHQVDIPRRGVFPFRRGLHLLRDLCRCHAEGN